MRGETPRETIAFWGYATAEWLAAVLPEPVGRWIFRRGGRIAFASAKGARATVTANLAQVLGPGADERLLTASVREAFDRYATYWYETFRVRVMSDVDVDARTRASGIEQLDRALEEGRGALVAIPHMGNWDAAGRYLSARGLRIAAVAEALRPKRLLDLFVRHREELGMAIIPYEKNGSTVQRIGSYLDGDWVVALVADRDLAGGGIEVEMFGATRRLPAGPAALSLRSGAPLFTAGLYATEDRGWVIELGSRLSIEPSGDRRADVAELTRKMAAEFERLISAAPTDWHMFQPAWP